MQSLRRKRKKMAKRKGSLKNQRKATLCDKVKDTIDELEAQNPIFGSKAQGHSKSLDVNLIECKQTENSPGMININQTVPSPNLSPSPPKEEYEAQFEFTHHQFLGSLDLRPVCKERDSFTQETANHHLLEAEKNLHKMLEHFSTPENSVQLAEVNIQKTGSGEKLGDKTCPKPVQCDKEKRLIILKNTYKKQESLQDFTEEKIIQRVQQIQQSYKSLKGAYVNKGGTKNEERTVIVFRDNNKKLKIDSQGAAQNADSPDSLFAALDSKRSGRKRRYAKLMKRLEDTEKSLETNFKRLIEKEENTPTSDTESDDKMEKVKKKLCLTSKKKYESLINYQRIKSDVEQKSFEHLLPDKVDIVNSNIVREISGEKTEVKIKRPRGRPRKVAQPLESTTNKEKDQSNNLTTKKVKSVNVTKRSPPKVHRKSLVDSTTNISSVPKADKIRLGIINKNGTKEIIELSDETLKAPNLSRIDLKDRDDGNTVLESTDTDKENGPAEKCNNSAKDNIKNKKPTRKRFVCILLLLSL